MLVPILEIEKELQTHDKTRFNAEKSFAAKGTTAINSITIQPSDAPAPIQVWTMGSAPSTWYLDWVFSDFKIDIDLTLNEFSFEDSSGSYNVTVPTLSYDLTAFASALQTLMNAVSTGYVVSVTDGQELKITNSISFSVESSGLANYFGFDLKTKKIEQVSSILEHLRRRVTLTLSNGVDTISKDYYIDVYNEYGDRLFSNDQDLTVEEPEILKWVVRGRSTHLNVHRKAQKLILDWLDKNNYKDHNGNKVSKWNILDVTQLQQWSQYIVLRFIFSSIYNASDDVFREKAQLYEKYEIAARSRSIIDMDLTNDGKVDKELSPKTWQGSVQRR